MTSTVNAPERNAHGKHVELAWGDTMNGQCVRFRTPTNNMLAFGLLALGLIQVGCGGSSDQPGTPTEEQKPDGGDGGRAEGNGQDGSTETGTCDMGGMFAQKCGSSACHEGDQAQAGLDLVAPGVEDRVSGAPAVCGGVLADSSDPGTSMLYQKISGTPTCGAPMPLGLPALTEAEAMCMREWISGLLPPPPPMPKTDDEDDDEPPPEAAIPHECDTVGEVQDCYSGPADTLGEGMCKAGSQMCLAGASGQPNIWGPCEGDYTGVAEDCNTDENEDCDSLTPASGCTLAWSRGYGMPESSHNGRSVALDSQDNIYLLGDFEATVNLGTGSVTAPGGKANIFLNKYDKHGNLLWSRTFGDSSSQFGQQVVVDLEDNPIIVNRAFGTVEYWDPTEDGSDDLDGPGETDIHVVKLDSDGNHLWSHVFGGVSADRSEDVAIDTDNNVYVTGTFTGEAVFGPRILRSSQHASEVPDRDAFVLKLSKAGEVEYAARYGGIGDDYGRGVAVAPDGSVYLAGYFGGSLREGTGSIGFGGDVAESVGGRDMFIAKLGSDLAHIWTRTFGSDEDDELYDIALDSIGDVVAIGYFSKTVEFGDQELTSAGSHDLLLLKLKADGSTAFARGFGDAEDQVYTEIGPTHTWSALAVDAADHIYVSTSLNGEARFGDTPVADLTSIGKNDVAAVEFDKDGSFVWGQRYGKTGTELVLDVAVASDGHIVLTGRTFGSGLDFGDAGEIAGRPSGGTVFLVRLATE